MVAAGGTVRLFVSSTFRDMHAERDHLNRFVFPELRSRCRRRGVEFVAVDLRWGVTGDEIEERGVAAVSLAALEPCTVFVGVLGERFGTVIPPETLLPDWVERVDARVRAVVEESYLLDLSSVPPVYRLRPGAYPPPEQVERLVKAINAAGGSASAESATAREIRHAAFESPPGRFRCRFYLRRAGVSSHPDFPRQLIPVFADEDPRSRDRLAALRSRIEDEGPGIVREYAAEYAGLRLDSTFLPGRLSSAERSALEDGVLAPGDWPRLGAGLRKALVDHGTVALNGLEEFGNQVLEDVWSILEPELPAETERSSHDPLALATGYHEAFLRDRTRLFFGREEILTRILEYVSDAGTDEPLVVHGPAGSGKSSVMAEAARRLRQDLPGALVLPYFVGVAPGSTELVAVLRQVSARLLPDQDAMGDIPRDRDELSVRWLDYLGDSAAGRPTVVVIDAVNQIDQQTAGDARWLPRWLPNAARLVVSTIEPAELPMISAGARPVPTVLVPPLVEGECRDLVQAFLASRQKRLTESQIADLLKGEEERRLPLYLVTALTELCLFGDFDALSARVRQLPGSLPELFGQLLGRLEVDHGGELTRWLLSGLAIARSGLAEAEILELADGVAPMPQLTWMRFYRAIEPYLQQRDEAAGAASITFFHDRLTRAVEERYLRTPDARRAAHGRLAGNFDRHARDEQRGWRRDDARALAELPHHLLHAGTFDAYRETVSDPEFVEAKCSSRLVDGLLADYEAGLASADSTPDAETELRALRSFVIREQSPLGAYSHVPGFVRQHLFNAGLGGELAEGDRKGGRLLGFSGCWFRQLHQAEQLAPLISVLGDHRRQVNECAFAREAATLASASLDGSIRSWDVGGWRHRNILALLPEGVTGCDVSPDGEIVASTCVDGHVRIHRGGRTLVCEERFDKTPLRCRLFDDDRRVLSVGQKGLMIHDVESGALLARPDLDADVHDCAFGPRGLVALACRHGGLRIYDPEKDEITETLHASQMVNVFGCAFSEDGRTLLAVGGNDLYLMGVKPYGMTVFWDTETWQEVPASGRKWPELATGCTHLSGQLYAVGFHDGEMRILSSAEPDWEICHKAHSGHLRSLATAVVEEPPSIAGRYLATGSADAQIRIWNVDTLTGAAPAQRPQGRGVFCAFSHDSDRVVVWLARVRQFECSFGVATYDLGSDEPRLAGLEELTEDYGLSSAVQIFSHDLAPDMPKQAARVSAWRLGSRGAHRTSPFGDWGAYWLVGCSARLMGYAFHMVPELPRELLSSRNLTWAKSVGGRIAVFRYGRLIVVCPGKEAAAAVEGTIEQSEFHTRVPPLCVFSGDSTRIYLGYSNEVFVHDAATALPICAFAAPDQVASLCESPSGDALLLGCRSGRLVEVDRRTLKAVSYSGHPGGVTDAAYFSDRYFLSIGWDATLGLWERGVTEPRARFVANGGLSAFALSPVTTRVVAATLHGDVHFLRIEGLDDEGEAEIVVPTDLSAARLIESTLGGMRASELLRPELENVTSEENRAALLIFLSYLFDDIDPSVASDLRSAALGLGISPNGIVGELVYGSAAGVVAFTAEVERKTFGPEETIVQVSQVIRGAARIVNALAANDLSYAVDVARRFVWPRTRAVLLAAIYGDAVRKQDVDAQEQVARVAGFGRGGG